MTESTPGPLAQLVLILSALCGLSLVGCLGSRPVPSPAAVPSKQPVSIAEVNRLLREGQIANQQLADQMLRQSRPLGGKLNLELNLADTRLTDEELKALMLPESLTRVDLTRSLITDAGLAHLATGKNIVELILINTRITTKGLEHLRTMPHLRMVNLHDTDIPPSEQLKFQKFLNDRPWN